MSLGTVLLIVLMAVIGTDGTVYVQTGDGPSDPANGKYSNALLAMAPKTLAVKGYFMDSSTAVPKVAPWSVDLRSFM